MHATRSFAEQTESYRQLIDARLDAYSQFDDDCPDVLRQAIRHSLLAPGKRLRPLLTLMAAEACGSEIEAAVPAACAVEMVHAYSLIHDDLPAMDDDDLRRGRPTCHRAFGEGNAILAGDALLTRAFEVIATDVRPEVAARCCAMLAVAAGASQMVGGQADDLAAEEQETGGLDELEKIHRRKTGAMLEVSLQLGGVIASATPEQLNALQQFGRNLGLAFQVVDDLLDFDGNEEELGKRTGKDANRGKLTYPVLLGVEASKQRAVELVDEAIDATTVFNERSEPFVTLAKFCSGKKALIMHPLLRSIESPEDFREWPVEELDSLADEIRDVLTNLVATRTAHYASNLGVVELCLALHSVYDFRKDRLIWDTGHQVLSAQAGHRSLQGLRHHADAWRVDGLPQPERERIRPVHDRSRWRQCLDGHGPPQRR